MSVANIYMFDPGSVRQEDVEVNRIYWTAESLGSRGIMNSWKRKVSSENETDK